MKNTTCIKAILLLISFSVVNCIEAQTDLNITTHYQGYSRSFRVHVPPGYSPSQKIPLVLVYHEGGISNSLVIKAKTRFDLVGDTANFITIFPQGLFGGWADSRGTPSDIAGIDDIGFTSFILDTIESLYNIDTTRIYAAGMSTGGVFCQRLALQLNTRIAAFASVGASIYASLLPYFPPSRKVPVLLMNGTSDARNLYYGGVGPSGLSTAMNTDTAIYAWASFDNCFPSPAVYEFPDINTTDLSTVTRMTYDPCQSCSEVILYRINNGGHTWPGGIGNNPVLGNANQDINGSHEIWLFFKRHQLQCSGASAAENLADIIERLELPNGLENSLVVKIENAVASCTDGNESAAINQLNAFINQVNAMRGDDLTEAEADQLIAFAQDLIDAIENGTAGCGSEMAMASIGEEIFPVQNELITYEGLKERDWREMSSPRGRKWNESGNNLHVYPNPANDEIHVSWTPTMNFTVKIINEIGETVFPAQNTQTVDVSQLQNGMYFLMLCENRRTVIKKIIVQH